MLLKMQGLCGTVYQMLNSSPYYCPREVPINVIYVYLIHWLQYVVRRYRWETWVCLPIETRKMAKILRTTFLYEFSGMKIIVFFIQISRPFGSKGVSWQKASNGAHGGTEHTANYYQCQCWISLLTHRPKPAIRPQWVKPVNTRKG